MDIGKFIYEELNKYRIASNKNTPTPFPQLVSLFLKLNNIWYLAADHNSLTQFGKTQIRKMKIGLPVDVLEESLSKKKRVEPEASKVDEAHSSRAPSPPPLFLSASIQVQIQEVLKPMIEQILKNNQLLMADIQNQVQAVIGGVDNNFQALYKLQANYLQQIIDIRHRPDCLKTHLTGTPLSKAPVLVVPTYINIPTASLPQSTVPSTSPTQPLEPSNILFSIQDHPSSSPVHITLNSSQQSTIPFPKPTPQTRLSQPKEVPDSQHNSPILAPQALGSPYTPVAFIPLPSISNPPQAPFRKQPSSSTYFSLPDNENNGDKATCTP